jgi:hypothetical protein
MYNNITSIEYIASQFPAITDDLHDEIVDGLLHLQIGEFSHMAQDAIDSHDKDRWQAVAGVFMTLWRDCTPDVTNALNVSFLEHLLFNDGKVNRSWAYKAMPKPMRKAWDDMYEYNSKIHGG